MCKRWCPAEIYRIFVFDVHIFVAMMVVVIIRWWCL
jgi:hypothetical protein